MPESITYNMDCMEFMRTLPDNHFDLAVVDPPYGGGGADNEYKGAIVGRFGGRFENTILEKTRRKQKELAGHGRQNMGNR